MAELLRASSEYLPYPCGFINNGSSCWFNALLNSLLSCPSFNKVILDNAEKKQFTDNQIVVEYVKILKNILQSNTDNPASEEPQPVPNHPYETRSKEEIIRKNEMANIKKLERCKVMFNAKLWAYIYKSTTARKDNIRFSGGQNCAGEGIDMFLDTLEDLPELTCLFELRTTWTYLCANCKEWSSSEKDDIDHIYKVPCNLMNEQSALFELVDPSYRIPMKLSEYIYENTGYIDKDHRCGKCNVKCEKFKITKMSFAPEIIIVMAKRYIYTGYGRCVKINTLIDFPAALQFEGKNEVLKYEAVSQIEHTGSLESGHYTAICKRTGGWYHINDQRVSDAEFKPTPNTYIVFYHISA